MRPDLDSWAGREVGVEAILWETPLPELALNRIRRFIPHEYVSVRVPNGHLAGGVPPEMYNSGFRRGLEAGCADIVVATWLPGHIPAVLAVKRAVSKCFGGSWWMMGGAIHAYRMIRDCVAERASKEAGVNATPEALIGFYRTCAEDEPASTIQPCYVATVPPGTFDDLMMANIDLDHVNKTLLSLDGIRQIPDGDPSLHWYPRRVFTRVLETMPPYPVH